LPNSFFERSPLEVGPDLLGKVLVSTAGGVITSGRIVETEAYLGQDDPGSHAATVGITKRNAVMYGPSGASYVYFTYGNHFMTNLVCGPEGVAGGVLLRALEPLEAIEVMVSRRHGREGRDLCNGPGKLSQALGIDLSDNGKMLGDGRLQVFEGTTHSPSEVVTTGRIGLTKGHELPYRFFLASDAHVSRARTGPKAPGRRSRL
jgi:DNA-3-methyladenine glycosylase